MILDKLAREIEAVIFAADGPVEMETLARVTGAMEDSILQALDRIEGALREGGHAMILRRVGSGWRIVTDPALGEVVSALFEDRRPGRLSRAALETLAVVAYSQPCTRAEVEEIRGVSCDSALRTLLEREMIRIAGRREQPGRPLLYATTPEFLLYFGLDDLDHLPRLDEISELLQTPPEELEPDTTESEGSRRDE
jgi:segregation and condensation protein B